MTPALTGTLLPGVTRDSLLKLGPDLGIPAGEGRISVGEWQEGCASGEITEVFACGTAAVITPVGAVKSARRELGHRRRHARARSPCGCARNWSTSSTAAVPTRTAGCTRPASQPGTLASQGSEVTGGSDDHRGQLAAGRLAEPAGRAGHAQRAEQLPAGQDRRADAGHPVLAAPRRSPPSRAARIAASSAAGTAGNRSPSGPTRPAAPCRRTRRPAAAARPPARCRAARTRRRRPPTHSRRSPDRRYSCALSPVCSCSRASTGPASPARSSPRPARSGQLGQPRPEPERGRPASRPTSRCASSATSSRCAVGRGRPLASASTRSDRGSVGRAGRAAPPTGPARRPR